MSRFFNTAGPVRPEDHYCLPPLERLHLDEVLTLIDQKKYFVLHAPRQTGKTTCLLALVDYLNGTDAYRALYTNVETGQTAREDVRRAMKAILGHLAGEARDLLNDPFLWELLSTILDDFGEDGALEGALTQWCQANSKPLVLVLDEIDALVGDSLISVLRQLRSGYTKRPGRFPQSVILCGVRDVRDYRIHSHRDKAIITGGSAFNIKAESLRLDNFSRREIERLYAQHTSDTGQLFTPEAIELAWELTNGQPWLVNALAYEVCFKIKSGRDRTKPITSELIQTAKEDLILKRETHLDQLVDKLRENRVRRVLAPIMRGEDLHRLNDDDLQYVEDLGLIRRGAQGPEMANAIYREVIPRQLSLMAQINFESLYRPAWYINPDGRLDMVKLLGAFQDFFRENSEIWLERFDYKEAAPQLLLQAFLQRIVNGGGRLEREYGLGRKRTDLLLIWPVVRPEDLAGFEGSADQPGGLYLTPSITQKVVLELKILRGSLEKTVAQGLPQTWDYADRSGADEAHLVIFDRNPEISLAQKIFQRAEPYSGRTIMIWGM